jgi:Ni/Co efflux regulator RcnB
MEETPMKRTIITLTAAALMATGLAVAQDNRTINQRRENQQDRIAQGVRSGRLSPRETAHLETREARLNHEIRSDRRAHDGHLTSPERRQINRQQNRMSKSIYRDKHDGLGR